MNLQQLKKRIGADFRLRPLPRRISPEGERLPDSDHFWRLEAILKEPSRLQLSNLQTGHCLSLQPDKVKEYRSPDFLLLRCQLTIRPQTIDMEPLFDGTDQYVRLEHQMPSLLTEMRNDLKSHPFRREVVLLKRSWSYWARFSSHAYHTRARWRLYY